MRWVGGSLVALVLLAVGLVALVWYAFQPNVTERARAPGWLWVARLERPAGSMEPKYYSVHIAASPLVGGDDCLVARVTGWEAEDYVRLSWPARNTLLLRYGRPRLDRQGVSVPVRQDVTGVCARFRVVLREDPSLAAAATVANVPNGDYPHPAGLDAGPDDFGNAR